MTEEKLFGWSHKQWSLFFGFQVLMFGLGIGSIIALTAVTGKNPLSLANVSPDRFKVLVNPNGTDIINSGGSRVFVKGGQFFNLTEGCYQVNLSLNPLAKQITVTSEKIDPSLC